MTKKRIYIAMLTISTIVFVGLALFMFAPNIGDLPIRTEITEVTPPPQETSAPQPEPEPQILERFASVLAQNPNTIGWIRIPGTNVDYPVVRSPETDWDFYLNRSFEGADDSHGTPYIWPQVSATQVGETDLLFVFAHNMADMSRFGDVAQYVNRSFLEEHPIIEFSSLYTERTYEIAYVFQVYSDVDVADFFYHPQKGIEEEVRFPYPFITTWENPDVLDYFIRQVRYHSIHDRGVNIQRDDKLLALWTCASAAPDEMRVIVIAVER